MAEHRSTDEGTFDFVKIPKATAKRLFDLQKVQRNRYAVLTLKPHVVDCILEKIQEKYKEEQDSGKWVIQENSGIWNDSFETDDPLFIFSYLDPDDNDDEVDSGILSAERHTQWKNDDKSKKEQVLEHIYGHIYAGYVNGLTTYGSKNDFLEILKECSKLLSPEEIKIKEERKVERKGMLEVGLKKKLPSDMWKQKTKEFIGKGGSKKRKSRKNNTLKRV